jgi:hypothetical protein
MSIDAFTLAYSRFTALGGCTTTSLYLICSAVCKQNSYDFFGRQVERLFLNDVLSAKGAAFHLEPGATPQDS